MNFGARHCCRVRPTHSPVLSINTQHTVSDVRLSEQHTFSAENRRCVYVRVCQLLKSCLLVLLASDNLPTEDISMRYRRWALLYQTWSVSVSASQSVSVSSSRIRNWLTYLHVLIVAVESTALCWTAGIWNRCCCCCWWWWCLLCR